MRYLLLVQGKGEEDVTTVDIIANRKKELAALEVDERLKLWLKIHKGSELHHNLLGVTGIVCAAVSSQLSQHPHVRLVTGLVAAISTALLTFLNRKARSITYINAWRILDKAVTDYLSNEDARLEALVPPEPMQNSTYRVFYTKSELAVI